MFGPILKGPTGSELVEWWIVPLGIVLGVALPLIAIWFFR